MERKTRREIEIEQSREGKKLMDRDYSIKFLLKSV